MQLDKIARLSGQPQPASACSEAPEVARAQSDGVRLAGLRLLNPGSPTDRRRQPTCSWMTAEIEDGQLHRVRLHRPDSR
jgi:hypothetical protein